MNRSRVLVGCVVLAWTSICSLRPAWTGDPPVWKPLADGKTLNGWHKNGDGDWTIEDGAYVGRSNNAKLYGHLVSDAKYQDVTVRFEFQCPSGDSGFFIRTEMKDPDQTWGMQIQVGPLGSGTGGLYESYLRNRWIPAKPPLELEKAAYRDGQWNEMIIAAHGPHITVHLNGLKISDLTDTEMPQRPGVFALQMHSGVVNETRFKNLAILEHGEITPKTFLGADVQPIKPADDGSISLSAANGLGVGPEIRYMPIWAVFAAITDKDRVEWPLEVTTAGPYEIWLDCLATDEEVGNPFVLEIGDQKFESKIARSESREPVKLGQLQIAAGSQRAVFRPAGTCDTTLCKLRAVRLVPAGK